MSRAVRATRGTAGAALAALFAAASHALAGGTITAVAVVATAILSMPLCVALAGRVASLWRLTIAVTLSQFFYHWTFSGLGVSSGVAPVVGVPNSPHAQHLAQLEAFAPAVVSAASADALMWTAHACAAAMTILVVHRGELAFLALVRLVQRALSATRLPRDHAPLTQRPRTPVRRSARTSQLREQLCSLCAISHRGPPVRVAS